MTGQEARDDEREAREIFEALADRLGEHPRARNHEIADSGEYETFMHEVQVETLAEWLIPTVLDIISRKHTEPEITDEALWDFATDLLEAWNIEDTNEPSLIEDFRDRFVGRFIVGEGE